MTSIVWLRTDLRLADNPALAAAVERGEPIVLLYLLDDESPGVRPIGGASRWWLHHSLEALAAEARSLGGALTLRRGPAERELPKLVDETDASAVYWNRRYGASREIDARLKSAFRERGITVDSFQGNLLVEPWTVTSADGSPYRVFSPFWRAVEQLPAPREPLPTPTALDAHPVASDDLGDWDLLPTRPDWAGGLRETWVPGEHAAHDRLERFVADVLPDYDHRDSPSKDVTSGLSPHLSFGEMSPFQIWHRVHAGDVSPAARRNVPKFLSELGWREFNHSILYTNTDIAERNYRPEFDAFPWNEPREEVLRAWQQGRTGIPLVDAGMRQLWHTGYMHNRVRMVTASFLVKNLLLDWRLGEQWFWDTLVDADEANNATNWQWVAGSGADPAPYFRVFNPVLQAEKFDPHREYIGRWVPELDTAEYPAPIVDLKASRKEALDAYEVVKRAAARR